MLKPLKRLVGLCLNLPAIQYQMAVDRLGVDPGLVVDLGCGDGALLLSLRSKFPHHEYVGVDVSLRVDRVLPGVNLISGDLFAFVESARFSDARVVILNEVIEHLSQEEITRLFALFQSRLKGGSVVFCQFPNCASPFGWRNQSGDPTHMTVLSGAKFERLIADSRAGCQYDIVGVDELGIVGHPFLNYATGVIYYKVVCKILDGFLVHSIGWNKHFWQPNLLVRIRYGNS